MSSGIDGEVRLAKANYKNGVKIVSELLKTGNVGYRQHQRQRMINSKIEKLNKCDKKPISLSNIHSIDRANSKIISQDFWDIKKRTKDFSKVVCIQQSTASPSHDNKMWIVTWWTRVSTMRRLKRSTRAEAEENERRGIRNTVFFSSLTLFGFFFFS